MAEVNFNSIYDGVSLALHAAFPAAQVHGGNVKQGLKPGDFNVIMPGAGHAKEVGQRYKRTPTEDVLHVLLSYDHFVRVPLEQENMETLKINEEG